MRVTAPLRAAPRLIGYAPLALLFGLAFWPTFIWMGQRFNAHDSFYSHGWLIPAASIWLAWQRRERLMATPQSPSAWGLALLVPALLLHVAAARLDVHFISGVSMLLAVWGMVWTLWGWPTLRTLRLPLLFLGFMVPLPGIVLIAASFKMKLFAASLATSFLQVIHIPAVQAGSTIHMGEVSVIVDDTCSGLRSLISLIALATLWTAFLPKESGRWRKLAIVAAALPIAIFANMVRILTLALLAAIYGPEIADGFIHYGSGVVVFGVALAVLAWLSRLLSRPMAVRVSP